MAGKKKTKVESFKVSGGSDCCLGFRMHYFCGKRVIAKGKVAKLVTAGV